MMEWMKRRMGIGFLIVTTTHTRANQKGLRFGQKKPSHLDGWEFSVFVGFELTQSLGLTLINSTSKIRAE